MNDHDYIQLEVLYGAHNYKPLDDVLNRGRVYGYGTLRATVAEKAGTEFIL